MKKKVLLIGWDAADWRVIRPLLKEGKMPALQQMMQEGVSGNITTLQPVLSPTLWTSIATGKRPFDHGILGFTEVTPDGSMVRPVTNLSRNCRAIWNILQLQGLKSNVVGWWPSNPVEPIDGSMLSNFYHQSVATIDEPWPVPPGTIHPQKLTKQLAELRVHPMEFEHEDILPFVPELHKIDQDKDRRLASVMKIVAECTSIHSAATWLWDNEPADFHAVYYDAIDHFSHLAMKYHPPKQAQISEEDFEIYRYVVEAGYRYHDMMLARWLELADKNTTIILISDHGFHPDHLRPQVIPHEPAGPAIEHRDLGIFLMKGPGVRSGDKVHGVHLLDICPTVLHLFNQPVGEDMEGKVISGAFESNQEVQYIESWENIKGDDGSHAKDKQLDPQAARESLQQLIDLGYIDPLPDNLQEATAQTINELDFNKACAYIDAQRFPLAVGLLERLWVENLREFRYGINLATCYRVLNRVDDLAKLVVQIREEREKAALEAQEKLQEWERKLFQRLKASKSDSIEFQSLSEPALSKLSKKQKAELWAEFSSILTEEERKTIHQLESFASIDFYSIEYFSGYVEAAKKNYKKALAHYQRALAYKPGQLGVHFAMAEIFLKLGNIEAAQNAYEIVLQFDDENARGFLGLSRVHFRLSEFTKAIDFAFRSIELNYHNPYAHFILGRCLKRLGELKHSILALETAISLNPHFVQAYRLLAVMHKKLGEGEKAQKCQDMIREIRLNQRMRHFELEDTHENFDSKANQEKSVEGKLPHLLKDKIRSTYDKDQVITIVSGLPRSGTSMMMQLLKAGGISILSDEKRKPDESNPKGYYELEEVKGLRKKNREWVRLAQGKALKVISQSLPFLPKEHHYRVVFMLRDLDEVIYSQRSMLKRLGKKGGNIDEDRLKKTFVSNLRRVHLWLGQQDNMEVILVDYRDCLERSLEVISALNSFMGGTLDEQNMSKIIDPQLYRERASDINPK